MVPRNGRQSNKKIYWCRRSDRDGSHETNTTGHKVNDHKIKTRTTNQYYTTIKHKNAMHDAISVPTQEPKNKKTNMVFMLVQLPEGFIASNQTGKFPRMSNRGMKYICVFYIHIPNYIKGILIKSRKIKNF